MALLPCNRLSKTIVGNCEFEDLSFPCFSCAVDSLVQYHGAFCLFTDSIVVGVSLFKEKRIEKFPSHSYEKSLQSD